MDPLENKCTMNIVRDGADTYLKVEVRNQDTILTANDIDEIREVALQASSEIRREIQYLMIGDHKISLEDSDSGRHLRVNIPNRNEPIANLKKGTNHGISISNVEILDEMGVLIYPTKADFKKSVSLLVDGDLFDDL